MNILYCGDNNVKQGLLISLLSLLEHTNEPLHVYVLTAKITNESQPISDHTISYLDQLVKRSRTDNQVLKLDITEQVESTPPTANFETIFTPSCMLRLYADQVPELPDRLLYLDTDVICRKDFTEFYHQNIQGYELAGVLDHYGQWLFYRRWPRRDYLNSGVLLLNLKTIRQTQLFQKCRDRCQTTKMFMPDQSSLNKLVQCKRTVPRRFNEQRRLKSTTVFQHFTTSFRFFPWVHTLTVKPWQVEQMHNKLKLYAYDDLLDEYQNLEANL